MKSIYFFIIAILAIILPFILVLADKLDWGTASAFIGPALVAIYAKWQVHSRDEAFKATRGMSYTTYKKANL